MKIIQTLIFVTKRKSGKEKGAQTSVRLSPSIIEEIDALAEEVDMTRSELIEDVFERLFDDEDLLEQWYPVEEEDEDSDSDSEPKRTSEKPELSVGLSS